MDRRSATVIGIVAAFVIGLAVTLVAVSGDDDERVRAGSGTSSTTAPTTLATSTTLPAPTTLPPLPTLPTRPPPTVIINPPSTTGRPSTTTSTPAPPQDPGITPTRVRISVIADDPDVVRGVRAWASAANRRDGLAGREIRVRSETVASEADYAEAVARACTDSFAVVGSDSAFDADITAFECGIPEVATRLTDVAHRLLPTSYAVIPERTGIERIGAFRYLLDNVDGCCAEYTLLPTEDPERSATLASAEAANAIGFTTAGMADVAPEASDDDYEAVVQDLVANAVTFVRSGLGLDSTVALRVAAAATPGTETIPVWYCDDRCYDDDLVERGGAAVDGQYVDIAVNPFSDKEDVPAIRPYIRAVRRAGQQPSGHGLEAYTAGLLFEEAARTVTDAHGDDGLTRARLLETLATIRDFTADGILGPTNVADREPNGCFALLRVEDGEFTRAYPTEPGILDCAEGNLRSVG